MLTNFFGVRSISLLKQRNPFFYILRVLCFCFILQAGYPSKTAMALELGVAKKWFNRLAGQNPVSSKKQIQQPVGSPTMLKHPKGKQRMRFGDSMWLYGCVVVAAKSVLDREGALENIDWVHMQVENRCGQPVRQKGAILVIYESKGGRRILPFWLLGNKPYLAPGKRHMFRLPALDVKNTRPIAWLVTPAQQRESRRYRPKRELAGLFSQEDEAQTRDLFKISATQLDAMPRFRTNKQQLKTQQKPNQRVFDRKQQKQQHKGDSRGKNALKRRNTTLKSIFTRPPALP